MVLPPAVAAKIAAGEVVERPASVVKELIENAIDAGASAVRVEIKAGGTQLIRVTDDGSGIPADELPLSIARHATSKIADVSDLDRVATLGFRGEALASIGAVAEMTLVSRTADQPAARHLVVRGGVIAAEGSRGGPVGTSVTVKALFREVPARLKFLRSAGAEASQISQVVCQYALAFPELRLTLINDDRPVFQSPGTGRLRDVLAVLYGADVAESLLAVDTQEAGLPPVRLYGFVSDPGTHRATRGYLSFFVNRRWVRNRALSFAVEEAYHNLLPEGRHPIAAIHVRLSPDEVDVNVHPAKFEVRFLHEGAVYSAVQRVVRRALLEGLPVSALMAQPVAPSRPVGLPQPVTSPAFPAGTANALVGRQGPSQAEVARAGGGEQGGLRVLGQLGSTFIVAEGPDGMYLVDQHRAHERVLYEQMQAERRAGAAARQMLMEPALVEMRPGQVELLGPLAPALEQMGFVLERFGERSFLVREVPAFLASGRPSPTIQSIFDCLTDATRLKAIDEADWQEELLISLACHGAIKSGQVLTHLEMHELMSRLEACSVHTLCPHAEPVMVHLSETAIRKQFGRERGQ